MLTQDQWGYVGVVAGALVAVLTLIGIVYRWVVRPVLRAIARTIRRLTAMADDYLGDEHRGIPSLPEQVAKLAAGQAKLETGQAELGKQFASHLDTHARYDRPATNGPRPVRKDADAS